MSFQSVYYFLPKVGQACWVTRTNTVCVCIAHNDAGDFLVLKDKTLRSYGDAQHRFFKWRYSTTLRRYGWLETDVEQDVWMYGTDTYRPYGIPKPVTGSTQPARTRLRPPQHFLKPVLTALKQYFSLAAYTFFRLYRKVHHRSWHTKHYFSPKVNTLCGVKGEAYPLNCVLRSAEGRLVVLEEKVARRQHNVRYRFYEWTQCEHLRRLAWVEQGAKQDSYLCKAR